MYIVVIRDDDTETINEYEAPEAALFCIKEAIEEDGVNPKDVTVYLGDKITTRIKLGKVEVSFL